ncbi:putative quinol monooxygenase [Quisquiliibacterium transsilvanicum]|jgi:quinol monooxygenase YgiN|uniref:Quinol monooxygenase YgiN n=1 Tax=Quisquiliibacterium transsilvanicum TaxID=1549638 RepID=A0A7W8HF67_9BURK|nr:putative quinol monooxygenase [Quisquiliibacterium transsilvanicum]MBB5270871.1 quinol monooxygenase YgiN [Quisquiliibacterium transsilvanicum]
MTLGVVAKIKVKDGQQAAFEAVASKLAKAVQANEPGCLLYTLNKTDDPVTYVFMERYKDEDAVKAHRGSDHFRSLGKEMGAFMDGPPEILRLNELA